jgi:hypothetical protein
LEGVLKQAYQTLQGRYSDNDLPDGLQPALLSLDVFSGFTKNPTAQLLGGIIGA